MTVRLMVFSTVDETKTAEFEAAFQEVRRNVATLAGHVRDELLREQGATDRYLLISEWETREQCEAWLRSPAHDEMTARMRPHFRQRSELRWYTSTAAVATTAGG